MATKPHVRSARITIELVFGFEDWLLEQKGDVTESPEDFLIRLEDALDKGDLDLEDIKAMLADYNGGEPNKR